jgi:hypothetical protein
LGDYPVTRDKIKADAGFRKDMAITKFNYSNSPYRIRVYLSLVKPGHGEVFKVIEEEFFLAEIMETSATPAYIITSPELKGNRFYVDKRNPMAGWGLGLGIATVLLVIAGTP